MASLSEQCLLHGSVQSASPIRTWCKRPLQCQSSLRASQRQSKTRSRSFDAIASHQPPWGKPRHEAGRRKSVDILTGGTTIGPVLAALTAAGICTCTELCMIRSGISVLAPVTLLALLPWARPAAGADAAVILGQSRQAYRQFRTLSFDFDCSVLPDAQPPFPAIRPFSAQGSAYFKPGREGFVNMELPSGSRARGVSSA